MSKISSRNTKFELQFIEKLKKITRRKFETHETLILGKPDIVFHALRICIFLDSDFWHGWQYPRWKHLMKNDFWREKIERNRVRDQRVNQKLRLKGWKVIRIWEHSIKKNLPEQLELVKKELNNQ